MVQILERGISFRVNSRTGYKKVGPFLERGINFRGNFFRTGCQFGVPGGTYPREKYPSAPPGFVPLRFQVSAFNRRKFFRCSSVVAPL